MKKVNIEQPVSNLYIKGWGNDINGNLRIIVGFPNDKGFSIQTNGNLPNTHSLLMRGHKGNFTPSELEQIGLEITQYVIKHKYSNVEHKLSISRRYWERF